MIASQDVYDMASNFTEAVDYDMWKEIFLYNEDGMDFDLVLFNKLKETLNALGVEVDDAPIIRDNNDD